MEVTLVRLHLRAREKSKGAREGKLLESPAGDALVRAHVVRRRQPPTHMCYERRASPEGDAARGCSAGRVHLVAAELRVAAADAVLLRHAHGLLRDVGVAELLLVLVHHVGPRVAAGGGGRVAVLVRIVRGVLERALLHGTLSVVVCDLPSGLLNSLRAGLCRGHLPFHCHTTSSYDACSYLPVRIFPLGDVCNAGFYTPICI